MYFLSPILECCLDLLGIYIHLFGSEVDNIIPCWGTWTLSLTTSLLTQITKKTRTDSRSQKSPARTTF